MKNIEEKKRTGGERKSRMWQYTERGEVVKVNALWLPR